MSLHDPGAARWTIQRSRRPWPNDGYFVWDNVHKIARSTIMTRKEARRIVAGLKNKEQEERHANDTSRGTRGAAEAAGSHRAAGIVPQQEQHG